MPANILLVNIHSTHNAGDAALMQAAIDQLGGAFPGARVTLLMNDPTSYAGPLPVLGSVFSWVKRSAGGAEYWRWGALLLLPWVALVVALGRRLPFLVNTLPRGWRPTVRAYLIADLVASCPGGFLFSVGFSLPLAVSVYIMALGLWAGVPVYVLPQSIGPLRRKWERALVGWLLRRARLVLVREPISLEQLPIPAAAPHVQLLPDTALTFAGAPTSAAIAWLASCGVDLAQHRPLLGVTAINWHAQNPRFPGQAAYEGALALACRRFITELDGAVVFFPQVCGPSSDQDDRVAARRVAARVADLRDQVVLIDATPAPALLKTAMGQMDLFLGTRMHSNIFALSGGVPFLAIAYQYKTQGIVRMVGLAEWVVPIEAAGGPLVAERLMALWAQRVAVRAHLEEVVPALTQQAAQAGPLVAADYAVWRSRG